MSSKLIPEDDFVGFPPHLVGARCGCATCSADDDPTAFNPQTADMNGPDPLASIDWGTQLDSNEITVYFAGAGERFDGVRSMGWKDFEMEAMMEALNLIETYIDVNFNVVTDPADADFKFVTTFSNSFLGYFNPPGTPGAGVGVFASNGFGWSEDGLQQGGFGFITLVHELGHGLGLAHPHDTGGSSTVWSGVNNTQDSGDFDLNQGIFTTMSYYDGWPEGPNGNTPSANFGYQGGIMALDIAALQQKYGENPDFNSGDTVYTLPGANEPGTFYLAIWDTGGQDTIQAADGLDVVIDLRDATLMAEEGGGGFVSYADGIFGGFTIANGVVIENAIGGSGDDFLIGNSADNMMEAGAGDDVVYGFGGNDYIIAGDGAGDDFYDGGDGDDLITFASTLLGVSVNLAAGFAKGDEIGDDVVLGFEHLIGGGGDDFLRGEGSDNSIYGGGGDDRILGGGGTDMLYGEAGGDAMFGQGGDDFLVGGEGDDILRGQAGNDQLQASSGDNVLDGGDGSDLLDGGSGDDLLLGRNGEDSLVGGEGNDNLKGMGGDDVITGGAGRDFLNGAQGADLFVFESVEDSTTDPANRDTILGFARGAGDLMDLSAIDADINTAEDDAFTIVAEFSGTAGELRYELTNTEITWRIQADVDGDSQADFELLVKANTMADDAFIL